MNRGDDEKPSDPVTAAQAIYDENTASANAKVLEFVLRKFHSENPPYYAAPDAASEHLAACDSTRVSELDAQDGTYGCDTGCEFATLAAVITCDHSYTVDYDYGTFGRVSDILRDITSG